MREKKRKIGENRFIKMTWTQFLTLIIFFELTLIYFFNFIRIRLQCTSTRVGDSFANPIYIVKENDLVTILLIPTNNFTFYI